MKPVLTLALAITLLPAAPVYAQQAGQAAQAKAIPLDEIRTFAEVFARVKKDYVEVIDDSTLLENAIRGMLEGLDPHSTYLDGEAYADLQQGTAGEFGGLGIEVGMENGLIKVISPIDDTPAARAGVKAGDLIIRLDDAPIKGLSLTDAVNRMRGQPGTDITLTIIRDGAQRPVTLTITRDIIKVKSVRQRTLQPGLGYLRISNFQVHTARDARAALKTLIKENDKRLDGLVLDLRNNPGGILSAAVAVADLFLDQGLIVYTAGRVPDSTLRFNAKPADLLDDAPIVVLVNAGSASASEIVAGALQDHRRAIIMGQQTFGKGSVQTILPISNEAALKLTTARYFTPSGRSIQAAGIAPDIAIDQLKIEKLEQTDIITEQNLNRHLQGEAESSEQEQAKEKSPPDNSFSDQADEMNNDLTGDQAEQTLAISDYALYEAVNVLKALTILAADE